MDKPGVFIRKVILGFILLGQSNVGVAFCPASCKCTFSNLTASDNRANCEFGSSSINITWTDYMPFEECDFYYDMPVVSMICKGMRYTCGDLPQFQIVQDVIALNVTSCSSNILTCINHAFPGVTTVEGLEIYEAIDLYTKYNFRQLPDIEYLRLHLKDTDTEIPMGILNYLPATATCHIIGGNIQLYSNMFNDIRVRGLKLNNNNINYIPAYTFNGTRLKRLEIINNNFEHISKDTLRGLYDLEKLSLKGNKNLKSIQSEILLDNSELQSIYLEYNAIKTLPNGLFLGLNLLDKIKIKENLFPINLDSQVFANLNYFNTEVELTNSKLRYLPENTFKDSFSLQHINLSYNMIATLPEKIFWTTRSLQYIYLNNNKIQYIPDRIFSKLVNVKNIDIRNNNILRLAVEMFTSNFKLTHVWLDYNKISILNLDAFNGTKLTTLSLAKNNIQTIIRNNSLLLRIEHLNLSNNYLSELQDWLVESLRLRTLNLTRNKIIKIKASHTYASNTIVKIDLRYNNISYIIRDRLNSKHFDDRNVVTNLSNNPWKCDCAMVKILNSWHDAGIVDDFEDILCFNNTKLSSIDIYSYCTKRQALIGMIGSAVVGTLIITILSTYIFSQRMKIWNYITSILDQNTDNTREYYMKEDESKPYDVFLSFAHQDYEFVADIILPKLEKDFGQNVCVHYRDWIVGELITDQIIKSVENSTMTIIILTESFLESEWSCLEFQTAYNLGIQEGRPKVIIILRNENVVRENKLTNELKLYISLNTYLLWGDANFWERLQKVLPRKGKKKNNKRKLQIIDR